MLVMQYIQFKGLGFACMSLMASAWKGSDKGKALTVIMEVNLSTLDPVANERLL